MDWIEDEHSRICQLNMSKHGVKVSKPGNYQTLPKMATSVLLFKKLPDLAIFGLNPTISFIVICYKRVFLPRSDTIEHHL